MQKHQYTPPSYNFSRIPAGNHRARISGAVWDVAKSSGRDKIVFTLKISGFGKLIYNFVWCDENPQALERTNYYLQRFCNTFNLYPEDMNNPDFSFNNWLGAEGGVVIGYDEGDNYPKIKKFLTRKQLEFLPPFQDGQKQQYIQQPQQQTQPQPQPQQQQQYYTQPPQQQNNYFGPNVDPSQQIPF